MKVAKEYSPPTSDEDCSSRGYSMTGTTTTAARSACSRSPRTTAHRPDRPDLSSSGGRHRDQPIRAAHGQRTGLGLRLLRPVPPDGSADLPMPGRYGFRRGTVAGPVVAGDSRWNSSPLRGGTGQDTATLGYNRLHVRARRCGAVSTTGSRVRPRRLPPGVVARSPLRGGSRGRERVHPDEAEQDRLQSVSPGARIGHGTGGSCGSCVLFMSVSRPRPGPHRRPRRAATTPQRCRARSTAPTGATGSPIPRGRRGRHGRCRGR